MTHIRRLKAAAVLTAAAALFTAGMMTGAATVGTPKSVLHIITVQWKDGTTDAQKSSVLEGVKKMAGDVGIRNVWLKTLKVQPQGYSNVMVMEFTDEAAFKKYTDSPAHKEWEKTYLPLRAESSTHDVTN